MELEKGEIRTGDFGYTKALTDDFCGDEAGRAGDNEFHDFVSLLSTHLYIRYERGKVG